MSQIWVHKVCCLLNCTLLPFLWWNKDSQNEHDITEMRWDRLLCWLNNCVVRTRSDLSSNYRAVNAATSVTNYFLVGNATRAPGVCLRRAFSSLCFIMPSFLSVSCFLSVVKHTKTHTLDVVSFKQYTYMSSCSRNWLQTVSAIRKLSFDAGVWKDVSNWYWRVKQILICTTVVRPIRDMFLVCYICRFGLFYEFSE